MIHHLGGQPTVRSVMFSVINILFSFMSRLLTSDTMVHHDSARWYHMACGGSL